LCVFSKNCYYIILDEVQHFHWNNAQGQLSYSGKLKDLINIYCFSDGVTLQYINRKNLINLCYHKDDFGMDSDWYFFAVSHGRCACDGIGGTIKRLARKARLQNPYEEQIMTPR
jgi:hypothetical protein